MDDIDYHAAVNQDPAILLSFLLILRLIAHRPVGLEQVARGIVEDGPVAIGLVFIQPFVLAFIVGRRTGRLLGSQHII